MNLIHAFLEFAVDLFSGKVDTSDPRLWLWIAAISSATLMVFIGALLLPFTGSSCHRLGSGCPQK